MAAKDDAAVSFPKSKGGSSEVTHVFLLDAGVKYDEGKPAYELLSTEFLEGIAAVSAYGAKKYEPWNWAKGLKYGRVYGALMRHLWAWWRGEENDSETGMSHLWHAGCCLMYLSHYQANRRKYRSFDDRLKRGR